MNPFNAITFAALCGPLAQPAAMAQDFIAQPAPIMAKSSKGAPSIDDYARSVEEGKKALSKLTNAMDDYYIRLVEMDSEAAKFYVLENGLETTEACEMFLRAFEEDIKKTIATEELPDFVATELRAYWRHIAKARSSATRLNSFSKGLMRNAVEFESETDLMAVKELASLTTAKMNTLKFH
ncbi:hypothetical protein [uncultured Pantoea sp.]|uniref:hypothetical protein n=1 Tax=uncultured Pantoea sp. TaxID=218084 RepID=UPI00258860E8|nr:hypothetical protein [uncultured Pantoea sp.]